MSLEIENEQLRQECARLREEHERCAASLKHYATIFDLSPSACLTIDPDGFILEANRSLAEMLNTSPETLTGKTFEKLVVEEDLARFRTHLQAKSLHNTRLCSDFRLLRQDGSTVPVMMQSVKIDNLGRCSFLLTDLQDITSRRLTEKALQDERDFNMAIFATSGALIIVLDKAGRILRFNQACERTSGYGAAEVIGKYLWEFLLPKEQVEHVRNAFDALLADQVPSRYENYWVTKTGELRLISWANSVLQADDGGIRAIIGSGLDITDQRQLEGEILKIAEREQRRIGTDLHDGLGQQLTAMSLMCENLRDDLDGHPPLKRQATDLGNHLRDAIAHTRNLSHGLMLRNLADEGLQEALETLASNTTAASSIPCEFGCDGDADAPGPLVSIHLYHIAQEAINNSLKHGAPSRIEIQLTCEKDTARLVIRDDGRGFASPPPTGLGMATMAYRANLIGGVLNVCSQPGAGVVIDCLVIRKQ
jgi:PAS domain S-box-containing protein